MKWFLSVPKICHTYWDGSPMSYMRYLTIVSFMKMNPDWRVALWTPSKRSGEKKWATKENCYPVVCTDFYPKLLKQNIAVYEVDFESFGFSNSMAEIHKSDYLRLYLLSTVGGLWSDMDIIYFKGMNKLPFNLEKNEGVDTFVCLNKHSAYIHSAGFLMSAPGSPYFKRLEEMAHTYYDERDYQSIGATMFNKYFPCMDAIAAISKPLNIDMDIVYAHDASKVKYIIELLPPLFTNNSIGIHWYAGHPMWEKFIKRTDGGRSNLPNSVIGNILMRYDNL